MLLAIALTSEEHCDRLARELVDGDGGGGKYETLLQPSVGVQLRRVK